MAAAAAAAKTHQNWDATGGKYTVVIIVVRFDVVRIGTSTRTRTFTESAADENSPTRATRANGRVLNRIFPSIIGPVPRFLILSGRPVVAGDSPFVLITTGYGLRLSRDTRERYRSPTSLLKVLSMEGCSAAHRLLLSSNHHVDFSRREYNQTASIYPRMMLAASVLAWMRILSQR